MLLAQRPIVAAVTMLLVLALMFFVAVLIVASVLARVVPLDRDVDLVISPWCVRFRLTRNSGADLTGARLASKQDLD